MSSYVKSILFALTTAVTCSLLLTAASAGLKGLQMENIDVDKKKNILMAVGLVDSEGSYQKKEILDIYGEKIQSLRVSPDGEIIGQDQVSVAETSLPIYVYLKDKEIVSYIIPVNSRGLWGKIHGYLALNSDGSTVTGFTVYKHSETPGLGGEIEKRWFQKNFEGKKILDKAGGFASISIAKGFLPESFPEDKLPNYVDGISGATLTGKYLTAGLKNVLQVYEPVSIKFRTRQSIKIREK
ncbi:MAG: FMN-binding protein [Desulfobacterales bacterium]|nr:FMN-binding protein [Desulfobacterales bacterium]MDX2512203.1 FMN-binding protein [Desulfobacterales bacterium]